MIVLSEVDVSAMSHAKGVTLLPRTDHVVIHLRSPRLHKAATITAPFVNVIPSAGGRSGNPGGDDNNVRRTIPVVSPRDQTRWLAFVSAARAGDELRAHCTRSYDDIDVVLALYRGIEPRRVHAAAFTTRSDFAGDAAETVRETSAAGTASALPLALAWIAGLCTAAGAVPIPVSAVATAVVWWLSRPVRHHAPGHDM